MTERRPWLRRSCAIALAPLLPLLLAAPANAARAGEGEEGSETGEEAPVTCPTDAWTVPLEVPGLACILLLPKEGGAGGGLLG